MRYVSLEDRFWAKVKKAGPGDCWDWTAHRSEDGYGTIRAERSRKMLKAHRVSFELHYLRIPANLEVMHSCDNPVCCNPNHLSLGTHAENMADMAKKGRATGCGARGEKSGKTTLTESDVRHIRSLNGVHQRTIANLYGITQSSVSTIVRRRVWAHVN